MWFSRARQFDGKLAWYIKTETKHCNKQYIKVCIESICMQAQILCLLWSWHTYIHYIIKFFCFMQIVSYMEANDIILHWSSSLKSITTVKQSTLVPHKYLDFTSTNQKASPHPNLLKQDILLLRSKTKRCMMIHYMQLFTPQCSMYLETNWSNLLLLHSP